MAVVSRIAKLVITDGVSNFRQWTATAAVQDTAAGSSVVVTLDRLPGGVAPPLPADTLEVSMRIDNSATEIVLLFSASEAATTFPNALTFYLTNNGLVGGAARCGTVRIRLRAAKTTGLAAQNYDVNSDTGGTPPSGFSVSTPDQGWIRGTTTAITTTSNVSSGGTKPAKYGFTYTVFYRTAFAAAAYQAYAVSTTLGVIATSAPSAAGPNWDGNFGVCDNRFPVSSSAQVTAITLPNAVLGTGSSFTTITSTNDTGTYDPRITFSQLLQLNASSFATPPSSTNNTAGQRLTSDLGFLAARAVDSNGVGINGLAWTEKLWDTGLLVSSEASPSKTRASISQTKGGQAGWSDAFLTWDSSLPGGAWTQKEIVTTANATGLELTNTRALTLLSANPNYRVIAKLGPATITADLDHSHAGDPILATFAIFDTSTGFEVAPDTGTPFVAIVRYDPALERFEYADAAYVWQPCNPGPIYQHALISSIGDAKNFQRLFTAVNTSTWNALDLFCIAGCKVGGTPYAAGSMREITGNPNGHGGYTLDAIQIALTGKLGTR